VQPLFRKLGMGRLRHQLRLGQMPPCERRLPQGQPPSQETGRVAVPEELGNSLRLSLGRQKGHIAVPVRHLVLLVVFCLIPSRTNGQAAAVLTGVLTDPSRAAVSRAEVSAERLDAAATSARVTTDEKGRFALVLAPGRYRIMVAHKSFAAVRAEVLLAAGETHEWSPRLELERLSATVIVTAQAEPVVAESSPSPATVITRQHILERQAVHFADLLGTMPGLTFSRLGREGGITTLFLGGGNSNYTRVLVDGAAVNEPGNPVDFSNFTLDNVEKIEVVRGAASALFGSDAVTGVIHVFTRRGTTTRPALELEAEGGKFETVRLGARLSGLLRWFDYSAALGYFYTNGQGSNDFYRNTTFSGQYGVRLRERDSLRLSLRSNTSDAGAPGQTLFAPPNLDQHNALRNLSASLAWEYHTGAWRHRTAGFEANLRQFFANPSSDFCLPDPPFICDFPFSALDRHNRASFTHQTSYLGQRGSLTLGYQSEVENSFLSGLHARRNNQGGYFDGRVQPHPRLVLVGGFRVESNDSFGVRAVPRFGLTYGARFGSGFWGATRLRFGFGLGIKEPTMTQSFAQNPCFPGNPDLRPERSRTVQAGVEQVLAQERVRASADWFDHRFRDIVSFTFCLVGGPCPFPLPPGCDQGSFGTFFNTDRARARGLNVAFEAKPAPWLRLEGAYSFVDSRVLEAPNAFDPVLLPGNRLFKRPVHSGSLVAHLNWRGMNWNVVGTFVGRRTDSDFLSFSIGDTCFGPCLSSNPGYAKVDLAFSYDVGRGATAFARVGNLFDRQYQDSLGYPAYRRYYRAGMRWRWGGE